MKPFSQAMCSGVEVRNTKVDYFDHSAITCPQKVGRFDVTMYYSLIVHYNQKRGFTAVEESSSFTHDIQAPE